MRTSNPTLSDSAFNRLATGSVTFDTATGAQQAQPWDTPAGPYGPGPIARPDVFTVEGATYKTLGLLAIAVLVGIGTVVTVPSESYGAAAIVGLIVSLPLVIATVLRPHWARITAPLYAVAEGVLLGAVSGVAEEFYPGVAMQAAVGTVAVLAVMLVLYRARIIRVTQRFRMMVFAATGAIFVTYLLSFILGFFGVEFGFLSGNSNLSILVSLVVIGVAALNLALDFDFIEHAAQQRLPAVTEWYAAFGLLVTLVWLYLEILRLLVKLQSRD